MPTYALTLEYEGTRFHGWQVQPGLRTVQGELRDALTILCREPILPAGAGRTDAGVHALGQVSSFVSSAAPSPARLLRALDALTGPDLVVRAARIVPDGFHARHSARRRTYRYRFLDAPSALERRTALHVGHPLDVAAMIEAARAIEGTHDFSAFAASDDGSPHKRCSIDLLEWRRWSSGIELHVRADRFLHHMVRNIVGTLIEVGGGRRPPESVRELLAAGERRNAGATAPALGLTLMRVDYDPEVM